MSLPPAAPVLALPDGAVQVGLAVPVVLRRLTRDEREFLAGLEGGRPTTAVERGRFARVVAALTRSGIWNDEPPRAAAAAVMGDASLAASLASSLRAEGVHVLREPDGAAITLVGGVGSPHPALTTPLMAASTPHIAILADDAGAWVSHTVVPGDTACTRCRDLAFTRANPSWPLIALQCHGRRVRLAPLAGAVAVARATARALAWIDTADLGTAERVNRDGEVVAAPLAPDRACGCGAAGPVGDELAARRARWR